MRFIKFAITLFVTLTPLAAQSVIEVSSSEVTVSDLASRLAVFADADPATSLARAPAPGVTRRVSRIELERWAASLGLHVDEGQLPTAVVLRRSMRTLDPAEAHRVILDTITEAHGIARDRLNVELLGSASPLVPAGEIELVCSCRRIALNETVAVNLRWREPGGRTGIETVRVVVTAEGEWLEAAGDITAGTTLSSGDVAQRSGDLPALDSFLSPEHLNGRWVLTRSIKSGQALTTNLVRSVPLVSRGDLVELRFQAGGVRLRTPGRAEEPGSPGDVIAFRNIATGQRLSARLADNQTAYVETVNAAR